MSCENARKPLGRVLVLGLGKTGEAVARYCAGLLGSRVECVTVYGGAKSAPGPATEALEALGCTVVCGTEDVEGAYDLCVSSPGISEFSDFFQAGAVHAREAIGEPEFAWRESPRQWVAITGTNGKTTTTTLARDLLRAGGLAATEVGNIGTLAVEQVPGRGADEWFVAELSSYQLACAHELHPRVAVLLNITPDHLSWHRTHENYVAAKERVFRNLEAGDLAILSQDDATCCQIMERLEARDLRVCHLSCVADPGTPCAAFAREGLLVVRLDGVEHELVAADSLAIRGEHNVENALAAAALALEVGVSEADVRRGLASFQPLEHRIEPCGELDGVAYVNDSKATNVDATEKALTAFPAGSIVLLLGGHDKGTALEELAAQVAATCRVAVCFGEAGARFQEALEAAEGTKGRSPNVPGVPDAPLQVISAEHLADAVDAARAAARPGDVVLLSPACSSFDEFSGFEERGRVFKQIVADLAKAGE